MIASLPMYDRPETVLANDRLWKGITSALWNRGIAAPHTLDRETGPWEAWLSSDLLLSQTCGLPYRTRLHRTVTLVASPVCDLPDAPAGHYYSVLIARRGDRRGRLADFDGATLACNDPLSQSGWAAPLAAAAEAGIDFGPMLFTGAHRASARAVAEGSADIAAIDAVTWAMIRRWDSFAGNLCVIGRTAATPALPWITAHADLAPILAEALSAAFLSLGPEDREALGITGAVCLGADAYLAVPTPPLAEAEPT